jgi:hypothetical protein
VVGRPPHIETTADLIHYEHTYYRTTAPEADHTDSIADNTRLALELMDSGVEEVEVLSDEVDSVITTVSHLSQSPQHDEDELSSLASPASEDYTTALPEDILDLTDTELLELSQNLQQLIDSSITGTDLLDTPLTPLTNNSKAILLKQTSPDMVMTLDDLHSQLVVEPWASPVPSCAMSPIPSPTGSRSSSDMTSPFSEDLTDFSSQWEQSFTELFPTLL